jgi:dihydroorotase/N-acyl-D-amino-acid deacylase
MFSLYKVFVMSTLLIKNGWIYDGLGNKKTKSSILIQDDKIEKIAPDISAPADIEIDASNKCVTPGFIDIHRHCDIKPFNSQDLGDVMLAQGITTTVVGNCGISMTPFSTNPAAALIMHNYHEPALGPAYTPDIHTFPQYMNALEKKPLPLNFAALIGTGSVKISIKGFANTPFSKEEMKQAQSIIDEAIQAGAAGVSVGIMYQPECYNTTQDYINMLKPLGKNNAIVAAHIRDEGDGMVSSVAEMIEIGKRVGCKIEISHFKSCNKNNWNREIFKAIDLIDKARSEGLDIAADLYPYDCGSTSLSTLLPDSFVSGDMEKALQKLGTPEGIAEYRRLGAEKWHGWNHWEEVLGWDRIIISGVTKEHNKKYLGKSVAQSVQEYGFTDGCELVGYLIHNEDGKTALINRTMCESDIEAVAKLPYSVFISDSIYAQTDTPHPRMYGAFPKVIRDYVNERHLFPLETAIKKMTSMPAARMKLERRGVLKEGYYADINIFDPAEFKDTATFKDPARLSVGLDYCIVNGKVALKAGKSTSGKFGRVIRSSY